jgi:hypothetical protein
MPNLGNVRSTKHTRRSMAPSSGRTVTPSHAPSASAGVTRVRARRRSSGIGALAPTTRASAMSDVASHPSLPLRDISAFPPAPLATVPHYHLLYLTRGQMPRVSPPTSRAACETIFAEVAADLKLAGVPLSLSLGRLTVAPEAAVGVCAVEIVACWTGACETSAPRRMGGGRRRHTAAAMH